MRAQENDAREKDGRRQEVDRQEEHRRQEDHDAQEEHVVTLDADARVFVDFDGTITDLDTFDVLVRRIAGDETWNAFERALDDGTKTLRQVLAEEAALVRGEFDEVSALLRREIAIDRSFADFVALCAERGAPLTIVSSGIEPIIRDRLGELGVAHLPVVANGLEAAPDGWRFVFRDDVPNGTDKAALVRAADAAAHPTIFIGDGRSDYDAALAARARFAKRGLPLERHLRANGVAYTAFSSFAEVIAALR